MIFESLLYKQNLLYIFAIKVQTDAITSSSLLDFLSFDKVTTTGLLLVVIWYFFKENKRIREKHEAVIAEKDQRIAEIQKEKEALIISNAAKG